MASGSLNGGTLSLAKLTVGGVPISGANSGTPVQSIATPNSGATPLTGNVIFAGSGVSSAGNTITFTGGGPGGGIPNLITEPATESTGAVETTFSAILTRNGAPDTNSAVFTGSAGKMELAINVLPGGSGSGNMNAVTATSGTPIVWVAGVFNPGDVVRDTSAGGGGGLYICSATTAATGASSTAPNTLTPTYWNLLVAPGNMIATTGTTGTPLVWSSSVVYNPGDVVRDNTTGSRASGTGGVYVCSANTASSALPPSQGVPSLWNLLAPNTYANMFADTVTSGTNALAWVSGGAYYPGQIVRDTTAGGGNGLYVCSATPTGGSASAAPHTKVPDNWNLLVEPGGAGAGATFTGDATGSVATNNTGNIAVSVSSSAQTGVLTTSTTMVLPPATAGISPIAYGIIVPGSGTPALPSWAGSGVAYTLTLSKAQLATTVQGGSLPGTIYQNAIFSQSWAQQNGVTTNPQGALVQAGYNPATGSELPNIIFNAGANPNNNSVVWFLWSAGS